MKLCRKCGAEKNESEFFACGKGRTKPSCKVCDTKRNKSRRRENKLKIVLEMGGKCSRCGYDKYVGALEFHHINPREKSPTAKYICYWKDERRKEELKKCILLCSNCHKEVEAGL